MGAKQSLLNVYKDEAKKYNDLIFMTDAQLTAMGNGSFTSVSNDNTVYTYTDGNDLLLQLQTVLEDYYISPVDFNNKCDKAEVDSKITTALTPIRKDMQNLDYNIYQLYLQNYYDGKNPSYRGMFFDGFANSNVIDIVNSTVNLDTTNKKISYEKVISNSGGSYIIVNNSQSMTNTISQSFTLSKTTKIKNIRVALYRYYNSNYYDYPISVSGNGCSNMNISISIYNVVDNLPSGNALVTSDGLTINSNTTLGDRYFSFSSTSLSAGNYCFVVNATYTYNGSDRIAISYGGAYSDGVCYLNGSVQSADLNFSMIYENNDNVVYQSNEQVFQQNMENSVLYVKSKTGTGCNISAQIAVYDSTTITFVNMTKGATRDLGNGYQEDIFTISGQNGNKVRVKITMSRSDILQDFYITNYGCSLGVY